MENGIYKSDNAYYFVKDNKILMHLSGELYKTTENFMIGAKYYKPLSFEMKKDFEIIYDSSRDW